jgi:hypothetical protein
LTWSSGRPPVLLSTLVFRFEQSQPKYPLHITRYGRVYYNVVVEPSLKLSDYARDPGTRKAD